MTTSPQARRGRPRISGVDERVLSITLDLLARDGYDAMSMTAVAAAAGITKPTLYRRWPSKAELVTSAVSTLASKGPDATYHCPWQALVAELQSFHIAISRPRGMALFGNVLALEERHPQLIQLYRDRVTSSRRRRVRAVLKRGQEIGVIRRDIDLDVIVSMLIGYYYAAYLGGDTIEPSWPEHCVSVMRRAIEVRDDD